MNCFENTDKEASDPALGEMGGKKRAEVKRW